MAVTWRLESESLRQAGLLAAACNAYLIRWHAYMRVAPASLKLAPMQVLLPNPDTPQKARLPPPDVACNATVFGFRSSCEFHRHQLAQAAPRSR